MNPIFVDNEPKRTILSTQNVHLSTFEKKLVSLKVERITLMCPMCPCKLQLYTKILSK